MSLLDLDAYLARAGDYLSGPHVRGRHDRLFFDECLIVIRFYIRMTVLFEEDEKEMFLQPVYKPAVYMKHVHPERQEEEEVLRLRERQKYDYIECTQIKKAMLEKFGVVIESSYLYFVNFRSNLSNEKLAFLEKSKGGIVWHCFIISTLYHVSEDCSRRLYDMYTNYYNIRRSASRQIYLEFLELLNYNLSHDLYCPILCQSPQYEIYQNDDVRRGLQKKILEQFESEVYFCFRNKYDFDVKGYDSLPIFFKKVCEFDNPYDLPPLVLKLVSLIIHTENYICRTRHSHVLSYEEKVANAKQVGSVQSKLILKYLEEDALDESLSSPIT
ncbi:MAG: hypothetical protein CMO44_13185 [Verrucomicrobiales bacterium]|nr:hypothetical protein [Verrucomicrobiales bacterium]